MTDEEFLARWSRRKRASKSDAPPPETAEPTGDSAVRSPAAEVEAEVDLGSLPSVDLITAGTDITAFLRKGVPQELMRGALRRAWSADPAIRDFVGLAENAWDFNDPNAMPGFGPLDCSPAELVAWVERIIGGLHYAAEIPPDTPMPLEKESSDVLADAAVLTEESAQAVVAETATSVPPQPTTAADTVRRRTHGGALPR